LAKDNRILPIPHPVKSSSRKPCGPYRSPTTGERSTATLSPEQQDSAARVFPCMPRFPTPFAPDCELSIPLERLRLETHRLDLPRRRSLGKFLKPPLHSGAIEVTSDPNGGGFGHGSRPTEWMEKAHAQEAWKVKRTRSEAERWRFVCAKPPLMV
jgi:hypothetical protein